MSLTPQAHFYRPSAAASVPFRRLSAHSPGWRFPTLRIGRPNLDLRSRFGQPVHNPKSLSVLFPQQRLLHSTTAAALANPKRSADHNTPHRTAHTQRANFTLAHKSVLVKFSFSRTATHCPRLAARSFSSICRPSERRNRFLQSEQTLCGSFLAAGCFSHSKGLVYFSFPSAAASASLEGFQPKRGDGHSHRPRCRPYPTAQPRAIWSAMFAAHSPTPCPQRKAFSLRYLVSHCRRSDGRQSNPQPEPPHTPAAQSAHANAPHAACHLCPRQPPTTHPLGARTALPCLRPEWRASHISCFRLATHFLNDCFL